MPATTTRQQPDPQLEQFCTPRQWETLVLLAELDGNVNQTAVRMGVCRGTIRSVVKAVEAKAAARNYAPEFQDPTFTLPEQYAVKGHSILERFQVDEGVVMRWTKTQQDAHARMRALEAGLAAAAETFPRLEPLPAPARTHKELCNVLTFTDYHLGMAARASETGADWDIPIAEALLVAAMQDMMARAPRARKLVLNIQGDFLHFDSQRPVTPTHGHVLDAAGSFSHMIQVAIRALRSIIDLGLQTHDEVELVMVQGNHDLASMVLFRHAFAAMYENELRLKVNASETPYYVIEFGKVMLGIHHGHMRKSESLPLLFAARYAETWGRTTKRYGLTGHRHHEERKEHPGMKMLQFPTLAPNDKHSSDGGWDSEREASLFTVHEVFGKVSEIVFTPEMVDLKAVA